MPYAIELFLDEAADRKVRQIWAAFDDAGLPSLGSAGYHPHVTLSVLEHGEPAEAIWETLATARGLPLSLASLGFFLTDEAPVFLGVVPTSRLLDLHRAIEPHVRNVWPYYRPDRLVPHCTLALGVTDLARIPRIDLPIDAYASEARIVELPTARTRSRRSPGTSGR